MSTQLRLIKTPDPATPAAAKRSSKAARKPARATMSRGAPSRGRRVRWDSDWRLSASRREIGLQGVAAARDALARAHRPPEPRGAEELSEAS